MGAGNCFSINSCNLRSSALLTDSDSDSALLTHSACSLCAVALPSPLHSLQPSGQPLLDLCAVQGSLGFTPFEQPSQPLLSTGSSSIPPPLGWSTQGGSAGVQAGGAASENEAQPHSHVNEAFGGSCSAKGGGAGVQGQGVASENWAQPHLEVSLGSASLPLVFHFNSHNYF